MKRRYTKRKLKVAPTPMFDYRELCNLSACVQLFDAHKKDFKGEVEEDDIAFITALDEKVKREIEKAAPGKKTA